MDESESTIYDRLSTLYATGDVPWDSSEPPPEVIEYLGNVPPGLALDLGCGYGRAAIYLASLGWEVDAVDFIPHAIAEATERAAAENVAVRFHLLEVTELEFLNGAYDFALDVGCCHNLGDEAKIQYHLQLKRLVRPGGVFMLFARVGELSGNDANGPASVDLSTLKTLFSDGFDLEWLEVGHTEVSDNDSWKSAWFRYRRVKDG